MKQSVMKLMLSFIMLSGLSSLVLAQNPPQAVDYTLDIDAAVATEITLNGTDADDDAIYFPIVRRTTHGLLTSTEDTLITGKIDDLEAGPFGSTWMFDQDGTPFTENGGLSSVYAYTHLNWNADGHGDGTCDSHGSGLNTLAFTFTEQLSMADGVYELDMFLDSLDFLSQTHINTEDPDNSWMTMAEAGEIRVYNQGIGGVKQNGVVKLAVENLTLWLKIFYPDPVGAGGVGGYASGFGVASIDQAASDPAWVAEFDPNGTGLIEIAFESFSQTVQDCYGAYDIVGISLQPISDAAITYTPEPGFLGVDNFSYVIFDGESFSNEIQVTLNVGVTDPVGDGTEANPYQIEILDDLLWISEHSEHWDADYIQIADIDATPTATWNSGLGFRAIGTHDNRFLGSYDGQGFTIDGLTINRPNAMYQGMFGDVYVADFYNIGLTNVNITGATYTGALAGESDASVNNCYSTGTVIGIDMVGGLIGFHKDYMQNSYSECTVTGVDQVGGLAGLSMDAWSGIYTSYSTGDVSGFDMVGGFVGNAYCTIKNSYSRGDVVRLGLTSEQVGGFAGITNNNHRIEKCYSTGTVSYTGASNPTDKGFVGVDYVGILNNNFYDMETSGQTSGIGAIATSTLDMKDYSTFLAATWDFVIETTNGDDDYWDIDNVNSTLNDGYPTLEWVNGEENAINPGVAPVVADVYVSTPRNESIDFILAGSDADGDDIEYNLWTGGFNGYVELEDSVVTFTPVNNFIGDLQLQYLAMDAFFESDLATIYFTVYLPNDAPVLEAIGAQSTNEDTAKVITLVATDADSDDLTLIVSSSELNVTASIIGNELTLTPNANWYGTANITVTVTDDGPGNLTASETFVFTVNPINDAPGSFALVLPENNHNAMDSTLTFTWEASNDVDSDDIFYTIRIYNGNYDNSFDVGTNLSFTTSVLELPRATNLAWNVIVNDSLMTAISNTMLFTVDVSVGQNVAPIATDMTVEVMEDSLVEFTLSGTDAENDELTIHIIDNPNYGVINSVGVEVEYAPLADYNGADTLIFTVNDAEGIDTGYVYIAVAAVNDAPGAFSQLTPANNLNITDTLITFTWEESIDIDGDEVYYLIHVYGNNYSEVIDVGAERSVTMSTLDMPRASTLDWMVQASDSSLVTGTGLWYFTVDPTVGIDDHKFMPETWSLDQNYPNPFNPSTTITFSVPSASMVRLTVYDVSGREIARLVDGVRAQGNYAVVWNGMDQAQNAVSSGMYFFRLEGEGFAQIKRMLYLK